MANPLTGEVVLSVDGQDHIAKLTLGALAALEARLEAASLVDLVGRFEAGRFSAADVLAVVEAGLQGGGWHGDAGALAHADICGGPVAAAQAAARLLALAFSPPA